jgi:hypothetical protein
MTQMLLFPDPRPLVERLGPEFFRSAPQSAGVYLMRDRAGTVLYVGKAKNLRKRLGSYRVANPDRMARRHLKLLRAVERIELRPCPDELAALATESALLRTLRPRFNRAGTWPGIRRFLAWRVTWNGFELAVMQAVQSDWLYVGPLGAGAIALRATLARLLWCGLYPEAGLTGLPEGWFSGRHREICTIPRQHCCPAIFDDAREHMGHLFAGRAEQFAEWIRSCTSSWTHPFDLAVREAELEGLAEFAARIALRAEESAQEKDCAKVS